MLEFSVFGTSLTAKISGELDHHKAKQLREKTDLKLASGIFNELIFDFSELEFMDSSGIAFVMGRVKILNAVSGNVKIKTNNESIKRIFKMAGVDKYAEFI